MSLSSKARRKALRQLSQGMTGFKQSPEAVRLWSNGALPKPGYREVQTASAPYLILGNLRVRVGNASTRHVKPIGGLQVVKTDTTDRVNRMARALRDKKAW